MDTKKLSTIIVIAALVTSVSAKEFIVGDDKGWGLNVDYQAWANGKKFVVGDRLVFKYVPIEHDVFKVNETAFKQCVIPPSNEALVSGNDVVPLETPGGNWFICGVGKHCASGVKLFINVQPLSKTPPPSNKVFIVGDHKGWILNVDFHAWAMGKEFVVGDKLVFKYMLGHHNVLTVNQTSFEKCIIPETQQALTSGNDEITLDTHGRKAFICGVGKHCKSGMRFSINVLPFPTSHASRSLASSSMDIIVGDDKGWTKGFDYQAWAKTKVFISGDRLVFRYTQKYNVFQVNATDFEYCYVPPIHEAFRTGNDVLPLITPGNKYYICGISNHCQFGMKLFINVLPKSTPRRLYQAPRKMAAS